MALILVFIFIIVRMYFLTNFVYDHVLSIEMRMRNLIPRGLINENGI